MEKLTSAEVKKIARFQGESGRTEAKLVDVPTLIAKEQLRINLIGYKITRT